MARVVEFENPDLAPTGKTGLVKTGKGKKSDKGQRPKMGRPLADIDWRQVEKMANIFVPIPEIAYLVGVDLSTLERQCKKLYGTTFAVWWKSKAAAGKMSLRRALLTEALGLEHDGYIREKDGSIARDPEGWPLKDKRPLRKPNTLVLLYLAKHVLDMEQEGRGYDPEEELNQLQDEREGTETVGLTVQFVGTDADEVNEMPAPGDEEESDEEATDEFPPVTVVGDDEGEQPDYTDYSEYE